MEQKFKRYVILPIIVVFIFFIGSLFGTYSAQTEVEDDALYSDELREKNSALKEENKDILDLVKQRDAIKEDYEKTKDKSKLLEEKISKKEDLLDSLTSKMIYAKSEPITLSPGQYIIGDDVPVNRYRVKSIGEGSNFTVHSSGGDLKVNTILGVDGVNSYIFFGEDGDVLETQADVKLKIIE
ncbi:hypothetical protein [Exiguobacterium sp.]|uniref:hypothetical protein n=1 Tax=Exiguobacterium sp. TaxID=44751 RepID=UPI00289FAC2B|nr:hypothetical protein [Exiguobacterium sp.]